MVERLAVALFLTAAFLVACADMPERPGAFEIPKYCGLMRNKDNRELRVVRFPLKYVVDYSVPGDRLDLILRAAQIWNEALGFEVIQVMGMGDAKLFSGTSTQKILYLVEGDWLKEFQYQQSMVTRVGWMGNGIYSADIFINDVYHATSSSDHFMQVMAHEFGHALGLEHHDDKNDIMYFSYSAGDKDYEDSFEKLRCAYGHLKDNPRWLTVSPPPSLRKAAE